MLHEITGRELIEYITKKDLQVKLNQQEAELIIKTVNNDGHIVCTDDETIVLRSVDQEGEHIEEVTISELVDMAAEINHISLMDAKSELSKATMGNISEYCSSVVNFVEIYDQKRVLDNAFEKNMNPLLKEILRNLKNNKESVDAFVHHKGR